ncbi:MAG TPA: 30S ribosomal protein S12 methylthiotransferase RimO, partial [Planctomycetes bacterium]|nr:30S ribosomal protein S12 methylthiotransferase RimO [Planctomycetota bacterium]
QPIAFAHAQAQVGQTLDVLVEGVDAEGTWFGRSAYDAPEIDPLVLLEGADLAPGSLVQAKIVAAQDYDLRGVVQP